MTVPACFVVVSYHDDCVIITETMAAVSSAAVSSAVSRLQSDNILSQGLPTFFLAPKPQLCKKCNQHFLVIQ